MNDETKQKLLKEILYYVEMEFLDEEDEDEIDLDIDTPLISGGIVDSFSMVSLKRFVEKNYNISIPDDKATPEAFDSINNIVALLDEYL